MTVRFNVRDVREHGLDIVGPLDPSFDSLLRKYFNGQTDSETEYLRPFCVFVRNSGRADIVAYVLRWDLVTTAGTSTTTYNAYSQPAVLLGYGANLENPTRHGHIIRVGRARLFSIISPIDPHESNTFGGASFGSEDQSYDSSMKVSDRIKSVLPKLANITVSLDAAFFADGSFVGPNNSGYFERVKAEINAKRDLLAQLASAAESPDDLNRVWNSIRLISNDEAVPYGFDSTPEQLYIYNRQEFAREMIGLRDAYGNERATQHFVSIHNLRKPMLRKL